ncbi:DUF6083 domain-containing protein [Streptomyces olivaceus]|uniref:DUF6083 domain-containing protein n=1 Tax=Streptomyces olivaceus TaxID=47716 RepID=UPI004056E383
MEVASERDVCQLCQGRDSTVASRGSINLIAEMCEGCWNRFANDLAAVEGATAPPSPVPDEDDYETSGPSTCPKCGGRVRRMPTYYDRWVDLATVELPAKQVPERYRWRLMKVPVAYAPIIIAVHIRVIDPLPSDPVIPAHALLCPAEQVEMPDIRA